MNAKHLLNDTTFTENEPIDITQLNRLYQLIGWDTDGKRTVRETEEMEVELKDFTSDLVSNCSNKKHRHWCGNENQKWMRKNRHHLNF